MTEQEELKIVNDSMKNLATFINEEFKDITIKNNLQPVYAKRLQSVILGNICAAFLAELVAHTKNGNTGSNRVQVRDSFFEIIKIGMKRMMPDEKKIIVRGQEVIS